MIYMKSYILYDYYGILQIIYNLAWLLRTIYDPGTSKKSKKIV